MSFLDNALGAITGNNDQFDFTTLLSWFNAQGGLDGIVSKFKEGGFSEVIESWVGNGESLPISGQQLEGVLGSDAVTQLSDNLNTNKEETSSLLAQYLPTIVNTVANKGGFNTEDLLASGSDLLKGFFK